MPDPVNFATILGQAQQLVPDYQQEMLRQQLGALQTRQVGLENEQIAANTRLIGAKMQQAQLEQQQQATFSAEAEQVIRGGDPRQIAGLIARYPQYGDQIKGAWDRMDSRIQSADLRDMGQIYAAANGGRFDLAATAMRRRIEADKAADGQADPQDEEILKLLESPDPADQKRGAGMVSFYLAAVTGPDKFASTYGELSKGEAGFTLSPGSKRYDKDGNEIASAPFAPRTVTLGEGQTLVEVDINGGGGGPASGGGGGAGGSGAPRNVRNNNPGNIIDSQFARSQPGYVRSDGRFAVFETPEAGKAAQSALLGSYIDRGFNTVEKIINRWAPPSENDTGTYVRNVARELGVDPRAPLGKAAIPKLAAAITRVEGGPGGSSAGVPGATTGGGVRVIAQGQPKQGYQVMTPEENRAAGLDPNVRYQRGPNGQITALGGQTKANTGGGKVMRQGDADKLEKQVSTVTALRSALSGFKDDFGGNTLTGETENWLQGLTGLGTTGQRDWWSNFRETDNLLRNELFGASLTDHEKKAYDATTVTPRMAPSEIRRNLQRRVRIAETALARRVARLKAAGFNSDEIDAATGGIAAGGIATVRTKQEAMRLAPGTLYRAPDGKVRRR